MIVESPFHTGMDVVNAKIRLLMQSVNSWNKIPLRSEPFSSHL